MKNILISRTDHLGDILLTLPMAGILKQYYPDCKIAFLVPKYAYDIIACCIYVDDILTLEECDSKSCEERNAILSKFDCCIHVSPNRKVAKWISASDVKRRIGTVKRWFHLLYCNELIYLSRKNSSTHEALLNLRLLKNLIPERKYSTHDLIPFFGFTKVPQLTNTIQALLDQRKFKLIIHTLSMGNTRHWSLANFKYLIEMIPGSQYQIILTGSQSEQKKLNDWIRSLNVPVLDLTGRLNLKELIGLINSCEGMLSNSTGPMHIAAVCDKHVLGLFGNYVPIHPNRWAPIGINAEYLNSPVACKGCTTDETCMCMKNIYVQQVLERILSWS